MLAALAYRTFLGAGVAADAGHCSVLVVVVVGHVGSKVEWGINPNPLSTLINCYGYIYVYKIFRSRVIFNRVQCFALNHGPPRRPPQKVQPYSTLLCSTQLSIASNRPLYVLARRPARGGGGGGRAKRYEADGTIPREVGCVSQLCDTYGFIECLDRKVCFALYMDKCVCLWYTLDLSLYYILDSNGCSSTIRTCWVIQTRCTVAMVLNSMLEPIGGQASLLLLRLRS